MKGRGEVLAQLLQPDEWHTLRERRTLARGTTAVQSYRIVELVNYGRALLLQECIQSTQADEGIYHQSLIVPPAVLHGKVRNVLCFGGANGGITKVLDRLPGIERVLQIDVDETLSHITRYYLPHMHPPGAPSFAHEVVFDDPIAWLAQRASAYEGWADLILGDLPDATADSYAPALFTRSFYERVRALLAPGGVYATGAGQLHPFAREFNRRVLATLGAHFASVRSYGRFVPSYGVTWGFAVAGDDPSLAATPDPVLERRIAALPELDYYDWPTHQHMFRLPREMRAEQAADPIPADDPLYVEVAAELPSA